MLFNNLDDDGKSVAQVERQKTQSTVDKVTQEHIHEKRPFSLENGMPKKVHGGK